MQSSQVGRVGGRGQELPVEGQELDLHAPENKKIIKLSYKIKLF